MYITVGVLTSLVFLILLLTTLITLCYGAPIVFIDKKSIKIASKLISKLDNKMIADLGSGDGRVVAAFAKKGWIVHGYEINPILVLISKLKIKKLGLNKKAEIFWRNYWKVDLSSYGIISVFGITHMMPKLRDKLLGELKKGSLIISYTYRIPGLIAKAKNGGVYLYKI